MGSREEETLPSEVQAPSKVPEPSCGAVGRAPLGLRLERRLSRLLGGQSVFLIIMAAADPTEQEEN